MIVKEIYPIIGMHCASCKQLIEKMVSKVDGVVSVSVNYATEKMSVEFENDKTSLSDISKAVESAGSYQLILNASGKAVLASPVEVSKTSETNRKDLSEKVEKLKEDELQRLKTKVLRVGILVIPFLFIMIRMVLIFFGVIDADMAPFGALTIEKLNYSINLFSFIQFLLATPILFWGGKEFFGSAFRAIKVKSANMDTLIVLGTSAAWIYSSLVTFFQGGYLRLVGRYISRQPHLLSFLF